jgi:hypothetical protein
MLPAPSLALSPEDRLETLQFLDEFRFWHSLDDERRCLRCHEIITGRQIVIVEQPEGHGRLRLQCPTLDCSATPNEWRYLDPVRIATFKDLPAPFRPPPHTDVRTANLRYRDGENGRSAHQHHRRSFKTALARLLGIRSRST